MKTTLHLLGGRHVAAALFTVVVILWAAMPVAALEFRVTDVDKFMNGPAYVVQMAGKFRRDPGEKRLRNVWIVMLDANGQERSRAKAHIDRPSKTWYGGVGDFRGVYFYAEFEVRVAGGGFEYFRTRVRRW